MVVEVVVNTATLVRSARGSITGEICLRSDSGEDFPETRWSDFPVVVLAWWLEALRNVVAGREDNCVGHFMDGPYAFIVQAEQEHTGRIAWGRRNEEEPKGEVDVWALQLSAVAAARRVIAACHVKGWVSNDLESLEQAVARSAA